MTRVDDFYKKVAELPGEWQAEYEERAAIIEFEAGKSRLEADLKAFREIERRRNENNA